MICRLRRAAGNLNQNTKEKRITRRTYNFSPGKVTNRKERQELHPARGVEPWNG